MGVTQKRLDLNAALKMPQARLVVFLYDETLEALDEAEAAILSGDIETRCNAVAYAGEVLSTLATCLDMEKGGEIAERLYQLYIFAMKRLPWINFRNDPAIVQEIRGILTPLRDSWFELDRVIEEGGSAYLEGIDEGEAKAATAR